MNPTGAPPRSKLFVPGNRPEFFVKALSSEADAICFDLEDSVPASQKLEARSHVHAFLSNGPTTEKQLIVRVNGVRSDHFGEDLAAAACPGVFAIALPKTEDPSEIEETGSALSLLEENLRLPRPISILPTIESPRGLRQASAIARTSPRIAGLQLGLADLFYALGIGGRSPAVSSHARMELRLAAAEAAVPCFDSAFLEIRDTEKFSEDAAAARSLGFSGKSCIHPLQVPIANEIFSPTAEEVALSLRIVEAARVASSTGVGAFDLEGHLVDEPVIRHAVHVIELANRLGINLKLRCRQRSTQRIFPVFGEPPRYSGIRNNQIERVVRPGNNVELGGNTGVN